MTRALWLLAAILRGSALCVCVYLLCQTAAVAQTAQPQPTQQATAKDSIARYIHAVPSTPAEYQPITGVQRLGWFARSTVGPRSLVAGLITAGFGTAIDSPSEYGTHWVGFGQRYGMRMAGISTENAMEATVGAFWGEDPRYFHTVNHPFGDRVKNIFDLTFRAYHPDGQRHLAYARYIAWVGSNFLSNTWRVQSEADTEHAFIRISEAVGGRVASNAFSELAPIVWKKIRHQPDSYPVDVHKP